MLKNENKTYNFSDFDFFFGFVTNLKMRPKTKMVALGSLKMINN